ncbi:MAG TPA: hypothetical protein DCS67_02300 [Clostridiales bacterium UBA8960]|nr:hypothetical protein [Clostridiales bacterium UBA8960]
MSKVKKRLIKHVVESEKGEFGISSIIGIAIGLIVAAFILIPGIETFATNIMTDMQSWWTNSIGSQIFPN